MVGRGADVAGSAGIILYISVSSHRRNWRALGAGGDAGEKY